MTNSESIHTIVFHAISIITFENFIMFSSTLVSCTQVCSQSSSGWASKVRGSVTPAVPNLGVSTYSTSAFVRFSRCCRRDNGSLSPLTFLILLSTYKYALTWAPHFARHLINYWSFYFFIFCVLCLLGYEPEGYILNIIAFFVYLST